ncbi:MAG: 1-acyl-sn-glycerol-3-phosphate acyltransferase [Candidatus Nanopelagicales bacterium]
MPQSDLGADAIPSPAVERRAVRTIMASPRFAETVADLADKTGRTPDDIRADAERCLDEMAAQIDDAATDVWDRFGRWLTRSYTVDADTSHLAELRALGRRHSLVFLPNHRSYLDPLVLRSALDQGGFPPNHILGGINLALWPLSTIAKRSGLVFIRRQFRDDPVYPAMLRLYLGFLLHIHANLEWYFEGGRTRTGKLRPPRMGVLRYLVDAFLANGTTENDVFVVPVAIVYDQQHEVGAISYEESGGSKRPESIGWLVKFARAQSRRRGRARVRFGQPLSLREVIDDARERAGSPDPTVVVPRVAFEIAHRINEATPITPSSLVTTALLDNDDKALTLAETLAVLDPFLEYARMRRLPLTSDVDLARPEGLRRALRTLVREGVVDEYDGGLEPVYSINRDRQHEAGFYRNTITHYFVARAITEVAAVTAAEEHAADPAEATWQAALALRDLLKYEFFFSRKREFAEEIRAESEMAKPGWETEPLQPGDLTAGLEHSRILLAHRVIGPFLEAYLVAADRLAAREPAAPVDEDDLVSEALGVARQRWLQGYLHSPESISKDLMKGALKLAGNRDLLRQGGEELRLERQAYAAELRAFVKRVGVIRDLAQRRPAPTGRED